MFGTDLVRFGTDNGTDRTPKIANVYRPWYNGTVREEYCAGWGAGMRLASISGRGCPGTESRIWPAPPLGEVRQGVSTSWWLRVPRPPKGGALYKGGN